MKRIFTLAIVLSFVSMSFGQNMLLDNYRTNQVEEQTTLAVDNSDNHGTINNTRSVNAGPDLTPSIEGFVKLYYKVPLDQASIAMDATVTNVGDELTAETDANLTVGTSYDENTAIPVPLGAGASTDITFPAFTATETGTVTFTVTAEAADDADPDNGMALKDLEIHEDVLTRNNDDFVSNMSIGSPGGILGGIYHVLAEDVLSGVNFYLNAATPGDIVKVVVYDFDGTPTDLVATAMDVLVTDADAYYTAYFAEELTLAAGTYYIGLIEGENYLTCGVSSDEYPPLTSWVYFSGSWSPVEDFDFFQVFMINPIFGEWAPPAFDMSLEAITMPSYILSGSVDVTGTIRNLSGEELTSIDVTYTINDGTPVMETFAVSVEPLGSYDFMFADAVDLTDEGAYYFDFEISNPNGMEDENPENDMLTHAVNVVPFIPTKRVFGEEATGTWCGWCPRGAVYMDYMADEYPDTWVGVAVHNNDPMVDPVYDAGIANWIGGYPNALVDRSVGGINPADLEIYYDAQITQIPPAELTIEGVYLAGDQLTFSVKADFVAEVSDFRLNAVIVEDHVTGTASGYNQANYYSGGGYGDMGGYEDLPNPVPAADMVYDHVGRSIIGGWDGVDGSLPATVYAGESHSHQFTTTLSGDWDVSNINVIGILMDNSNGSIQNVVQTAEGTVSVPNTFEVAEFSVYPNPAVDHITIDAPNADRIEVVNYLGQVIFVAENANSKTQINVKDYDAGIYFVRVSRNDEISTRKVVIK